MKRASAVALTVVVLAGIAPCPARALGEERAGPAALSDRSVLLVRSGDRAVRSGDFSQALTSYARAAEASPAALLPRLLVGVSLTAVRRMDLAVAQYKIAARLAESDALTSLLLQGALAERGDVGEAQEIYLQTVRRFSRPGRQGIDASGSLVWLKAAVQTYPDSAILQLLLGDVYQLQEQWGAADQAYRRAIALAPDWAKPRINLGLSLLAQNRPERAVDLFQAALRQDPNSVQARLAMGEAQLKTGRNTEAIRTYQQLERTPGAAVQAVTGIAQANVNLRRFDTALNYLDTAQKLAPRDPAPLTARAEVQMSAGDFGGAAASYGTALQLSQESGLFSARPSLLRALAEAQLSARRPADAVETLKQALRDDPERAFVWHRLLAHAYAAMDDRVEMETALRRALETETRLYPQETLNAIAARGLIDKTIAYYRTQLEASRTGIGGGRTESGGVYAFSAPISREAQARALASLGHLARYRGATREEVSVRRDLCTLRGWATDWFLLAEAQERVGERQDAIQSYRQALAKGNLPATAWSRAQQRLKALSEDGR